jgi:anti-sigma factor RsiW
MMDHEHIYHLLPAYLDQELGGAEALDVQAHADRCDECRRALDEQRAVSARIKGGATYFQAPGHLRVQIDAALPQGRRRQAGPGFWQRYWSHALAAAAMVLGAGAGVGWYLALPPAPDRLAEALVDSHIRSLQVDHLADVASSDRHTVKPWFNGKLDFSPPVATFDAEGFPLVGGRLDYLGGHAVAVLVYRHNRHPINLYVWPSDGADAAPRPMSHHGYQLRTWRSGGMAYWAVSDVAANDLENFVQLVRSAATK